MAKVGQNVLFGGKGQKWLPDAATYDEPSSKVNGKYVVQGYTGPG